MHTSRNRSYRQRLGGVRPPVVLLPLREKVASEGGRMRGRAASPAKVLTPLRNRRRAPSSVVPAGTTPSPARGEGHGQPPALRFAHPSQGGGRRLTCLRVLAV